jgi:subtilisin family serine protease
MHAAGTVAGNRQGWAKKASIYNINPYSSNTNVDQFWGFIMWDYIRAFHKNKPINPITGRRNPTICNGSYGSVIEFPSIRTGPITEIFYRGTTYTPSGATFTDAQLENFGIFVPQPGVAETPFYSESIAADIEDAIADGIIVVASAGNSYSYVDVPGGIDYDNYFLAEFDGIEYAWYFNRGTSPAAVPGVICVGAIGSLVDESKAVFSNTGPRIDIFAPGQNITSSVLQATSQDPAFLDPRNPSFRNAKNSGTSMSSPQVAGVLACFLETYPRMTPDQALDFIVTKSKKGVITDTNGGITDDTALNGAENRYLFYLPERPTDGTMYPKENYGLRTSQGQVFPRSRIYRYGS